MFNFASIISNIAMIGNAIATIAVLLKGQSPMFQMNCNPVCGTPMPTVQAQNVSYPTYQQPQPMMNNNYGYGYGYAQQEPAQTYADPYVSNSTPVNPGYPTGQTNHSYYNNQYCAPVWSIDPVKYNSLNQPMYSNNYDNNIWFDYRYRTDQNHSGYGYNYNAYNYQSRRSFDNCMSNYNQYSYNWPYRESNVFNQVNNNAGESFDYGYIQRPVSPWAKQPISYNPIQNWNQNFLNKVPKVPAGGEWTKYDPHVRPENRDAYLFG